MLTRSKPAGKHSRERILATKASGISLAEISIRPVGMIGSPGYSHIFFNQFNIINFRELLIAGVKADVINTIIDEAKMLQSRGKVMYVLLHYSSAGAGKTYSDILKMELSLEEFEQIIYAKKDGVNLHTALINSLYRSKVVNTPLEVHLVSYLDGPESGWFKRNVEEVQHIAMQTLFRAGCAKEDYEVSGVLNAAFVKACVGSAKAEAIFAEYRFERDTPGTGAYLILYRDLEDPEREIKFIPVRFTPEEVIQLFDTSATIDLLAMLIDKLDSRIAVLSEMEVDVQQLAAAKRYLEERPEEFLDYLDQTSAQAYLETDEGKAYLNYSLQEEERIVLDEIKKKIPGFDPVYTGMFGMLNYREVCLFLPMELWDEYRAMAMAYREERCFLYVLFERKVQKPAPKDFSAIEPQKPYPLKLAMLDFERINRGEASLKEVLTHKLNELIEQLNRKLSSKKRLKKEKEALFVHLQAAEAAYAVVNGKYWESYYLKGLAHFFSFPQHIPGCGVSDWRSSGIINFGELKRGYLADINQVVAGYPHKPSAGFYCYYILPNAFSSENNFVPFHMVPEVAIDYCRGSYNPKDLLWFLTSELDKQLQLYEEDSKTRSLYLAARAYLADCTEAGWLQQIEKIAPAFNPLATFEAEVLPSVDAGEEAVVPTAVVESETGKEIDDVQTKIEALREECAVLAKQIKDLQRELAIKKKAEERSTAAIREMTGEHAGLLEKQAMLFKDHARATLEVGMLREGVTMAEEDNRAHQLRNSELEREMAGYRKEIRKLNRGIDELSVHIQPPTDRTHLTVEISALASQSGQLREEIGTIYQTRAALDASVAKLDSEVRRLPTATGDLQAQNRDLASRLAALEAENKHLEAVLAADSGIYHPAAVGVFSTVPEAHRATHKATAKQGPYTAILKRS